jgi:hypothetical protein
MKAISLFLATTGEFQSNISLHPDTNGKQAGDAANAISISGQTVALVGLLSDEQRPVSEVYIVSVNGNTLVHNWPQ